VERQCVVDAVQLAAQGVPFALGTDGTRYDGFRLMDAAEATQRSRTAWRSATRPAAAAGCGWTTRPISAHGRGLAGRHRRDRRGQAADFLLLDLDVPELQPSWDLSWELVRLADRSQVEAVVVTARCGCGKDGRSIGMRKRYSPK
jgi:cytosine/adenosine deaminase-related metal-dependent hydrolase